MTFDNLLQLFRDKCCVKVLVKKLVQNNNSKQQIYLGGNFEALNNIPFKDIIAENPGDWKRPRFKAPLDFHWINTEGETTQAKHAQLILYPKYPEVRLSAVLKGAKGYFNELIHRKTEGRLLFLGISEEGSIFSYISHEDSDLTREFNSAPPFDKLGVFSFIPLELKARLRDSRSQLISELKRIHSLGWIDSRRLDISGNTLPCISPNCGGYTLEAEFGITPNGFSEPDFLGWEIKQFAVKKFHLVNSSVITLMTPEPTAGLYRDNGVEEFIRRFGYKDQLGREARMNFGGVYKYGITHKKTQLQLILNGYDAVEGKITDSAGYLGLQDLQGNIAAAWSFASLLKHWNRKHAKACYVPSMSRKVSDALPLLNRQYIFGSEIILGDTTDFLLLLKQISLGNVYYDPGIKLEFEIPNVRIQNIKRRSQFRVRSGKIAELYKNTELVKLA